MIAFGSDHAGQGLKKIIMEHLEAQGIACRDYGWTGEPAPKDYPIYALAAANAVAGGECEKGIVICGTGIGVSLAANKVQGIRCAVCTEPYSALMSREHNDANMLALGARVTGPELAKMIVDVWLKGVFQGGTHANRVEMIKSIEKTGGLK
jgi:ribose 5-phosphate isomerase B